MSILNYGLLQELILKLLLNLSLKEATSWFYLAKCYEKLADFTSAKNAYVRVIDLRNEYMEAYQSLCIILLRLNEPLEAVRYAQIASELDKENYIYDFIIGTAYMKNKKSLKKGSRSLCYEHWRKSLKILVL